MSSTSQPVTDGSLTFEVGPEGQIKQTSRGDDEVLLDPQSWPLWRKTALTRAARIRAPFTVQTSEGPLRCEDGWLAVDARGYPYPIAAAEFDKIYEGVRAGDDARPDSPSFVERLEALQTDIRTAQSEGWGDPRELAIALTALEDAQMRTTRARAKKLGVFKPVDLERVEAAAERERFEQAAAEAG